MPKLGSRKRRQDRSGLSRHQKPSNRPNGRHLTSRETTSRRRLQQQIKGEPPHVNHRHRNRCTIRLRRQRPRHSPTRPPVQPRTPQSHQHPGGWTKRRTHRHRPRRHGIPTQNHPSGRRNPPRSRPVHRPRVRNRPRRVQARNPQPASSRAPRQKPIRQRRGHPAHRQAQRHRNHPQDAREHRLNRQRYRRVKSRPNHAHSRTSHRQLGSTHPHHLNESANPNRTRTPHVHGQPTGTSQPPHHHRRHPRIRTWTARRAVPTMHQLRRQSNRLPQHGRDITLGTRSRTSHPMDGRQGLPNPSRR